MTPDPTFARYARPWVGLLIFFGVGVALLVWNRTIENVLNDVRRAILPPTAPPRRVRYGIPLAMFGTIFALIPVLVVVGILVTAFQR